MIQGMRAATRGWIAGGIIALIGLALVITLIPGALPRPASEVVSAKGFSISAVEYERELQRYLDQARDAGQNISRADLVESGQHRALLDQMINERALAHFAKQNGVQVVDAAIGSEIRKIPEFSNQITGGFDKQRYFEALQQVQATEAEFVENIRRMMAGRELLLGVTSGVSPPNSLADFLIAFQTEERTIDAAQVPLGAISAPPEPTQAQIDETYRANVASFAVPETRTLSLVVAELEAFTPQVEVAEDDVRQLYDLRRASLAGPERRSFVQISAPDEGAAKTAARLLEEGQGPSTVAAEIGGAVQARPLQTREDIADRAIADAVFAAAAGGVASVRGQIGWVAVQVGDIAPPVEPSFDDAREQLIRELAQEEAQALLTDAMEAFEDRIAEGAELAEAAKAAGLRLAATPATDAQGRDPMGAPIDGLVGEEDLLTAAFATQELEMTEFTLLSDGDYASARVEAITPRGTRPQAEVRPQIVEMWRAKWIRDQIEARAEQVRAAVKAGESFAEAVRAAGGQMVATDAAVPRQMAQQDRLADAVFNAKPGEVVHLVAGGQAIALAHVKSVTRMETANVPEDLRSRVDDFARQQLAQDFAATLTSAARAAANARINETTLNQIVGVTPDEET